MSTIPFVIEKSGRGERAFDIYSRLLRDRVIFLTGGVSDDVAQVSITSGSPTKPPAWPRCAGAYPGGTSVEGSIGRLASSAGMALA